MSRVVYARTGEQVLPGDIISTRLFFFFRKEGTVVYVPGISPKRSSLEYNGLTWVGIQELSGSFFSALVDPNDNRLDNSVEFLRRGAAFTLPSDPDPFIEPGEIVNSDP
jgi:hypothetical protein